jgi:hypothetical protein
MVHVSHGKHVVVSARWLNKHFLLMFYTHPLDLTAMAGMSAHIDILYPPPAHTPRM